MQNYLPQYRQVGYRVVPVSNEFEMNNITVDFNGTPTYFHNQNLNEIYVKQFDIKTGLTTTQKFVKADNAGHEISGGKSDLGINTHEENFRALNERLDRLENLLTEEEPDDKKGGKR